MLHFIFLQHKVYTAVDLWGQKYIFITFCWNYRYFVHSWNYRYFVHSSEGWLNKDQTPDKSSTDSSYDTYKKWNTSVNIVFFTYPFTVVLFLLIIPPLPPHIYQTSSQCFPFLGFSTLGRARFVGCSTPSGFSQLLFTCTK